MGIVSGWQPGADVEELADLYRSRQIPDGSDQKPPVSASGGGEIGID